MTPRERLAAAYHQVVRDLVAVRGELAIVALFLVGWALLTDAVAALLPHAPIWRLSGGVFCLSLFGWGFLLEIARKGLYKLTLEDRSRG